MDTLPPFYQPIEGMDVVSWQESPEEIEVVAVSSKKTGRCPHCDSISCKKHSRYVRSLRDLPVSGKRVTLVLQTNKWFCFQPTCHVKVFTERLSGISSSKRYTDRLHLVLQELAFSMSAKAAERCSKAIGAPLSHDAFLYLIRAMPESPPKETPFRRHR
ncbi:transposase family protein [Alkalicoccus chagannorensis]